MPYPVSLPPPPAIIDVAPEESGDAAISPTSAPSSEFVPEQASPSASIDLQILDAGLLESSATKESSSNQAALLGTPVEVAWPATPPESLAPIGLPSIEPSASAILRQSDSLLAGDYSDTLPASRLPELSHDLIAQDSIAQDSIAQDNTQPLNDSLEPDAPDSSAPAPSPPTPPASEPAPEATPTTPETSPAPPPQPGNGVNEGGTPPVDPMATEDVLELNADRQEYDERNRVFQAEGNVELLFRGARLTSTRLLVNIPNRIAVAEGDAVLTRGAQVLRGDRIEYNLVQNQGNILGARGELSIPSISQDTAAVPPTAPTTPGATPPGTTPPAAPSVDQPLQVFGSTGGLTFGIDTPGQDSGNAGTGGQGVGRLRFEADQIEFMGAIWTATNVRITNDPFSPPELELRSNRVTVTPLGPGRTEIRARNPRLVFDQGFSLPLLQERFVIDNRERNPGLFSVGFDEEDRGGLFIERGFDLSFGPAALLTLRPQLLVQRAIDEGFGASSFGLIAQLDINPSPTTTIEGNAIFTTFDFEDFEDTFRGSFRAQQQVLRHTVGLEYSYRDRLYNGSLGFQDVQSSLGLVVTSPTYVLGDTGINLTYQAGAQYIDSDANSDRLGESDIIDLLDFNEDGSRDNNRIDLARYQAAASLNRFFTLWSGIPLPPTPDQGLRYTPNPIVPYFGVYTALRGVFSAYSNGDTQSVLTPSIGIAGQFGHFSRPFLDYTAVGVSYSYNAVGGETPFNFDRVNDIQTLTVSLNQQIYGPFRFGVRSTFYLESVNEREDDADTTFTLEYSRRTYSITVSYSPQREAGAVGLRISDFNWVGDPGPFTGLGVDEVSGGVRIPGQ